LNLTKESSIACSFVNHEHQAIFDLGLSSFAMSISLSRDELYMSPARTKLRIMNFQSREWLNSFQWLI